MSTLALKVPPVMVWLIAAASTYALHQFSFALPLLSAPNGLVVVPLMVGGVISLLGVWEFRRKKTTVDPTQPQKASQLVNSGIFKYTRNPMYLGMLLVLLACLLKYFSVLGMLFVPLFVLYMTQFQIKPEENIIEGIFGQPYQDYKQAVRRWI